MHPMKTCLHNNIHIAGVLVQARPELIPQLQTRLGDVAGLEIHTVSPDGRMVITIESDGRKSVADTLFTLNAMQGVLSACLVYEHSETDSIPL